MVDVVVAAAAIVVVTYLSVVWSSSLWLFRAKSNIRTIMLNYCSGNFIYSLATYKFGDTNKLVRLEQKVLKGQ